MAGRPAQVTIGVMGSGADEHRDLAEQVGGLLARLEVNLLTGAGRGVMTSVSRAFIGARRGDGITIGIVPCASDDERAKPKPGSPNPYVELPILTHLPYTGERGQHDLSRNHINVLSSHAIIVLPGRSGTASEVELALRYQRPVIGFGDDEPALANLSPQLDRVYRIGDVEAFLRDRIPGRLA